MLGEFFKYRGHDLLQKGQATFKLPEKRVRFLAAIVVVLFHGGLLKAQSITGGSDGSRPTIIPPSPEAASLGKYGDIPVGLYTGIPGINVPIFTITNKNLSVPISLSYHAGGIKVDEIASNVGLGWSLNAGGNISITVKSSPDFEFNGYVAGGYIIPSTDPAIWGQTQKTQMLALINGFTTGVQIDTEPDDYFFSFGGKTGKFNFSQSGKAAITPYQPLEIGFNQTATEAFTIRDADGITYYFKLGESIETVKNLLQGTTTDLPRTINTSNAYYLSRIVGPLGESVTFNYETEQYTVYDASELTEYRNTPASTCTTEKNIEWSVKRNIGGSRITSIVSSNGFTAIFSYSAIPRLDIDQINSNKSQLDKVQINYQGNVIKTFSFGYDYFKTSVYDVVSADQKPRHCRLKLLSVKEEGTPGYVFKYKEPTDFPARLSYSQDLWGYFNGIDNLGLIPQEMLDGFEFDGANRTSIEGKADFGILTQIAYPTGGTTSFEFESNKVGDVNTSDPAQFTQQNGSIFLSGSLDPSAPSNASAQFTIPSNAVKCDGALSSMVRVTAKYVSSNDEQIISTQGYGGLVTASITGPDNTTYPATSNNTVSLCLAPGTYTGTALVADPFTSEQAQAGLVPAYAGVSFWWYVPVSQNQTITETVVGGLRIKKITDNDGGATPLKIKSYQYLNPAGQPSGKFAKSYPTYSQPGYALKLVEQITGYDYGFGFPVAITAEVPIPCSFYIRNSTSATPLGAIQGSSVAYPFVSVMEGENGEGGKTDSEFSFLKDYNNGGTPIVPDIDYDWARGMLLHEKVFASGGNNQFNLIKETRNFYDMFHNPDAFYGFNQTSQESRLIFPTTGVPSPDSSPDPSPITFTNQADPFSLENNLICVRTQNFGVVNTDFILSNFYKKVSAIVTLKSSVSIDYSATGTVSTTNKFYYDNPDNLQIRRIVTEQSDGMKLQTINKYASDYIVRTGLSVEPPPSGPINNLLNANRLNTLVEKQQWKMSNGGSNYSLIGSQLQGFKELNSVALPSASSYLQLPSAINDFTDSHHDGDSFVTDQRYTSKITYDQYDINNNLIQYSENGIPTSVVWGYAGSFPIAEIKNATINQVFYTGFEDDGDSADGDSHTGVKSKTGGFSQTLNSLPNGSYSLTYWTKLSNVWTLQSQNVSVTSGVYTINLSGQVDDVRFFPVTAQLTTYTHSPGVGITSATDTNNVSSFYEYDSFGRLQIIRDKDRKILKRYSYNYRKY